MNQFTVSARLWFMVGLFAMVILVGALIGLGGTRLGVNAVEEMYTERTVPARLIAEAESLMQDSRLQMGAALQTPKDEVIAQAAQSITANNQQIATLFKRFEDSPRSKEVEEKFRAMLKAYAAYQSAAVDPAVAGLKSGDLMDLKSIIVKKARPLFAEVKKEMSAISALYETEATVSFDTAQSRYRLMLISVVISVGVALFAVVLYGRALVHSITGPLEKAVDLAERVAAGDLTADVDTQGRDELARLLGALQGMNQSLAGVVQKVRSAADSIATGSAQIATGNADLSHRTEQQAANLQRTAASMEELSVTVRQNADSARQADQVASTASNSAGKGGEVVGRVVGTMQDISASSRRIADIIGVIDGIAFQTNILALNAAVEAARAGESGRGFAVVASEVRSLAGRSADAAKEIKQLIGQSVETVESGSRQAQDAGASMQDIVRHVSQVSQLIAEISSASGQQTHGIEQVSEAVSQLDQVTQANSSLVEEAAAAAESLRVQAGQLVDTVAGFRLP